MRRLLLAILLLPAALPNAAAAATVFEEPPSDVYLSGPNVRFRAAVGELNNVTVTVSSTTGAVTLRDPGVPVGAGTGCHSVDAHTVTCDPDMGTSPSSVGLELGDGADAARLSVPSPAGLENIAVEGGAGDDSLDASAARGVIGPRGSPGIGMDGGAGDDRIVGSPDDDTLSGGSGRDTIDARAGFDSVTGNSGDDRLSGGSGEDDLSPGSGNDTVNGGTGGDTANYEDHRRGVVVDLARHRERGARGEVDTLRSVRDVVGGAGHDVLRGDAGPNSLFGFEPGESHARHGDVLIGRGGRDDLEASGPRTTLDGGRGGDRLSSLSRRDRLRCDGGSDTVESFGDRVFVPRTCERIRTSDYAISRISVRGGRAHVRIRAVFSGCRGRLTLRSRHGALFGKVRWRGVGRRTRRLSFPLTAAGMVAAAGHRVVVARAPDSCFGRFPRAWRVRL